MSLRQDTNSRDDVCVCGHLRAAHRSSEVALIEGECKVCDDMECLGFVRYFAPEEVQRMRHEMLTQYPDAR